MNKPTSPSDSLFAHPITHITIAALILAGDVTTGPDIRFPILFVVPVISVTWYSRPSMAYVFAVLLPLLRHEFFFGWAWLPTSDVDTLNTVIQISVLLLVSYLTARTAELTHELASRVVQLEGLLPICAHCHQIRDDQEVWHRIEEYITRHSSVQFSHGICPACLQKYYSDVFAKKGQTKDTAAETANPS